MANIPGLTAAESAAYVAAMLAPGAETFRRALSYDLDISAGSARSLSGILSGQVRWKNGAPNEVRTEATLTVSDFDDRVSLDLSNMVRIYQGVDTDAFGKLWAPLVTGWVQAQSDAGWETEVTLHGKEKFGLRSSERGHAKKGERVGECIWRMHWGIGERHIIIPDWLRDSGPKLAEGVEWGGGNPDKCVTVMSRRLAKRAGLQVLFNQLGQLDLRPIPEQPKLILGESPKPGVVEVRLLSPVRWDDDWSQLCNRVIGGGRRSLRAVAETKGDYKFSSGKLLRGGERIWLTHRFSDDTVDNRDELKDLTEQTLRNLSTARTAVSAATTPAAWLLPEDLIRAERRDGRSADFWMGSGSLEVDGSSMAIGYQRTAERAKGIRIEASGRGYTDKERKEMRREKRQREERRRERRRGNNG